VDLVVVVRLNVMDLFIWDHQPPNIFGLFVCVMDVLDLFELLDLPDWDVFYWDLLIYWM